MHGASAARARGTALRVTTSIRVALNARINESMRISLEPDSGTAVACRQGLTDRAAVVHVFAGVQVEAVPGNCVLADLPEHLRVIVPRTTQYQPAPPAKSWGG